MTKKQLRRAIIKMQNRNGINKYDARRAVEKKIEEDRLSESGKGNR